MAAKKKKDIVQPSNAGNMGAPAAKSLASKVLEVGRKEAVSPEYGSYREVKWYSGSQPTNRETLARMYTVSNGDKDKWGELYGMYTQETQKRDSPIYNPYAEATTYKAIQGLADLGYDVSKIDDNFFRNYEWLKNEYRTTDNGYGAAAPTKKSTDLQNAAYYYMQLLGAEERTKAAETDLTGMADEVKYWADRGYSDAAIIQKVQADFSSKYKTLAKMDEDRTMGEPTLLNRATGYNQDTIYGMIYAARNGGGSGDWMADAVNYTLGKGNAYKADPASEAAHDPTSIDYDPYSFGSNMDELNMRYGMTSMDRAGLEANRSMLATEDGAKDWRRWETAIENAEEAELELNGTGDPEKDWELDFVPLNQWIKNAVDDGMSADDIIDELDVMINGDDSDYKMLSKMEYYRTRGSYVDMASAVDFTMPKIKMQVEQACADRDAKAAEEARAAEEAEAAAKEEAYQNFDYGNASLGQMIAHDREAESRGDMPGQKASGNGAKTTGVDAGQPTERIERTPRGSMTGAVSQAKMDAAGKEEAPSAVTMSATTGAPRPTQKPVVGQQTQNAAQEGIQPWKRQAAYNTVPGIDIASDEWDTSAARAMLQGGDWSDETYRAILAHSTNPQKVKTELIKGIVDIKAGNVSAEELDEYGLAASWVKSHEGLIGEYANAIHDNVHAEYLTWDTVYGSAVSEARTALEDAKPYLTSDQYYSMMVDIGRVADEITARKRDDNISADEAFEEINAENEVFTYALRAVTDSANKIRTSAAVKSERDHAALMDEYKQSSMAVMDGTATEDQQAQVDGMRAFAGSIAKNDDGYQALYSDIETEMNNLSAADVNSARYESGYDPLDPYAPDTSTQDVILRTMYTEGAMAIAENALSEDMALAYMQGMTLDEFYEAYPERMKSAKQVAQDASEEYKGVWLDAGKSLANILNQSLQAEMSHESEAYGGDYTAYSVGKLREAQSLANESDSPFNVDAGGAIEELHGYQKNAKGSGRTLSEWLGANQKQATRLAYQMGFYTETIGEDGKPVMTITEEDSERFMAYIQSNDGDDTDAMDLKLRKTLPDVNLWTSTKTGAINAARGLESAALAGFISISNLGASDNDIAFANKTQYGGDEAKYREAIQNYIDTLGDGEFKDTLIAELNTTKDIWTMNVPGAGHAVGAATKRKITQDKIAEANAVINKYGTGIEKFISRTIPTVVSSVTQMALSYYTGAGLSQVFGKAGSWLGSILASVTMESGEKNLELQEAGVEKGVAEVAGLALGVGTGLMEHGMEAKLFSAEYDDMLNSLKYRGEYKAGMLGLIEMAFKDPQRLSEYIVAGASSYVSEAFGESIQEDAEELLDIGITGLAEEIGGKRSFGESAGSVDDIIGRLWDTATETFVSTYFIGKTSHGIMRISGKIPRLSGIDDIVNDATKDARTINAVIDYQATEEALRRTQNEIAAMATSEKQAEADAAKAESDAAKADWIAKNREKMENSKWFNKAQQNVAALEAEMEGDSIPGDLPARMKAGRDALAKAGEAYAGSEAAEADARARFMDARTRYQNANSELENLFRKMVDDAMEESRQSVLERELAGLDEQGASLMQDYLDSTRELDKLQADYMQADRDVEASGGMPEILKKARALRSEYASRIQETVEHITEVKAQIDEIAAKQEETKTALESEREANTAEASEGAYAAASETTEESADGADNGEATTELDNARAEADKAAADAKEDPTNAKLQSKTDILMKKVAALEANAELEAAKDDIAKGLRSRDYDTRHAAATKYKELAAKAQEANDAYAEAAKTNNAMSSVAASIKSELDDAINDLKQYTNDDLYYGGSQNYDAANQAAARVEELSREYDIASADMAVFEAQSNLDTSKPETIQAYKDALTKRTEVRQNNLKVTEEQREKIDRQVNNAVQNAPRAKAIMEARKSGDTETVNRLLSEAWNDASPATRDILRNAAGIKRGVSKLVIKDDTGATGEAGLTRAYNATQYKLDVTGEKQMAILDALAKDGGFEIVVHPTVSTVQGARNGVYFRGNTIHIGLDAIDGAFVQTGFHETVHWLAENNADAYGGLSELVQGEMARLGEDVDALVRAKIDAYAKAGENLDYVGALEEVVAESAALVLTDEQNMIRFAQEHRGAFEAFKDAFLRFWEKLKNIAQSVAGKNQTPEQKALLGQSEALQKIYDNLMAAVKATGQQGDVRESVENGTPEQVEMSDANAKFSLRTEDPPEKTGIGYKVFFVKDGKLYPPMVANPNGADTPVGVWLNADIGASASPSKTGRLQVKAGGKGTQGGSGSLAFRPGWHLGDIPFASQFDRLNPETGVKELFPAQFVWAECEYAADVDYQEEAMSYGYTDNGKFRHSYAGLPRLPENGFYKYRTNPNPETVPWIITGAMKVNRILTHAEVDDLLVNKFDHAPTKWQGEDVDVKATGQQGDEANNKVPKYSMNKTFIEQIDELRAGTFPRNDHLYVMDTPDVLVRCGFDRLPLLMTQKHAKSVMKVTGAQNVNYHGLTRTGMAGLPDAISNAIAVIKAPKFADKAIVLTEMRDGDGDTVIAPIQVDGRGRWGNVEIDANILDTAYGKDSGSIKTMLINAIMNDEVLYVDKKRSYRLEQSVGVQFPKKLLNGAPIHSIRDFMPNVNTQEEKNSLNALDDDYMAAVQQGGVATERVSEADIKPAADAPSIVPQDSGMGDAGFTTDNTIAEKTPEAEVKNSFNRNGELMLNAIAANKKTGNVDAGTLEEAANTREAIRAFMEERFDALNLPADIEGNTWFSNSSYGGTMENSLLCPRTMGLYELSSEVADTIGRPLTLVEQLYVAQEALTRGNILEPTCNYCYVWADRAMFSEYIGKYLEQRKAVMDAAVLDGFDYESAWAEFIGKRKPSAEMHNRFDMWVNLAQNGGQIIGDGDVANIERLTEMAATGYEGIVAGESPLGSVINDADSYRKQLEDIVNYAQSSSHQKTRRGYAAYNGQILKWTKNLVKNLNSHYGARMYSFSDFSPAYVLESMQMITDAAVKGAKMLGYTKSIDFARIFAPTGMNINISVYGFQRGGVITEDKLMGAPWAEVQELRDQYDNVGAVFVAVNDEQVKWALDQDWIDVVIPYHSVFSGGKTVANALGFDDYRGMQAETLTTIDDEGKKRNKKTTIPAAAHNNDKATFLDLCEKNGLTPRFAEYLDNPNYMRLVNECRQSVTTSAPVQPIFDLESAKIAVQNLADNGGYNTPIGGSRERQSEIAAGIAADIASGNADVRPAVNSINLSVVEDYDREQFVNAASEQIMNGGTRSPALARALATAESKTTSSVMNRIGENPREGWKRRTPSSAANVVDGQVNGPTDVMRDLTGRLGVSYIPGSNIPRGKTQGFYDARAKLITTNTKSAGEMGTNLHEFGHAVDGRLGWLTANQGMIDALADDVKQGYSVDEINGEAVTEFIVDYIFDRDEAVRVAGDQYVRDFEAKVRADETLYKTLEEAKHQVLQWSNASTSARIKANMGDSAYERQAQPHRNIITRALDAFQQHIFDDTQIGERISRRFHGALQYSRVAARRGDNLLRGDFTDLESNYIGDGFQRRMIKAGITADMYDDIGAYLLAEHALERRSLKLADFDPVTGAANSLEDFTRRAKDESGETKDVKYKEAEVFSQEDLSSDDLRQYINDIRANRKDVVRGADIVRGFWSDVVDEWLVPSGLVDAGTRDAWRTRYPNYVPTYRVFDESLLKSAGYTSGDTFSFPVKSPTGSTLKVINPIVSIIQMTQAAVNSVSNNQMMNAFGRELQKMSPEDAAEFAYIVPDGTRGNVITAHNPDGSTTNYLIRDKTLYNVMSGNAANVGKYFGAVGKAKNIITELTTTRKPTFAAKNAKRDIQSSVNTGTWASNYATGVVKWIDTFVEIAAKEKPDLYKMWVNMGGGGYNRTNSAYADGGRARIAAQQLLGVAKRNGVVGEKVNALEKVLDTITLSELSELVENTSRYIEFAKGKHDLSTYEGRVEAFNASQEVTVNFGLRGDSAVIQFANRFIPFFNANLQGINKTITMLRDIGSSDPALRNRALISTAKTVVNNGIMAAIQMALLAITGGDDDDEEYAMAADYARTGNLMIKVSAGGRLPWLRLPIGQDVLGRSAYAAGLNLFADIFGLDEFTLDLWSVGKSIVDDAIPSGSILSAIQDIKANRTWSGNTLVSSSLQGRETPNQYRDDTLPIFRTMSEFLYNLPMPVKVSPVALQYAFTQYSGVIGEVMMPIMSGDRYTGEWSAGAALDNLWYTIRKPFFIDPVSSNSLSQDYQAMKNDVKQMIGSYRSGGEVYGLPAGLSPQQISRTMEALEKANSSRGFIGKADKKITKLWGEIDKIEQNRFMSNSEKDEAIRDTRRQIDDIWMDAMEEYQRFRLEYMGGDAIITAIKNAAK